MPAKKSSPKRTSPQRSPVRKVVREAEYALNEVDAEPSKEIFKVMNMLGYLFVVCALAAAIAWIYYIAEANKTSGTLGDDDGATSLVTATVCFQACVASALVYFVARHHFSTKHY